MLALIEKYNSDNVMEVQQRFFPALIGKGGSVIRGLQDDTKASIDLNRQNSCVRIRGSEEAIAKAKEAILAILEKAGWSENLADETVHIDERDIPTIIGKGGVTIRAMSEESGARFDIDRESLCVQVTGDAAAVAKGKELLNGFLQVSYSLNSLYVPPLYISTSLTELPL